MKSLTAASTTKKVVALAAVVLLAGFFIFPWAVDWGRPPTILRLDNPRVFGDSAYEIAIGAPILWLVPVGALLIAILALIPWKANRRQWIKWVLIFLIAAMILYVHAWITDTLQLRTLSNPALKNDWPGTLYFAWDNNQELLDRLVYQDNDVLGGDAFPDYGYRISLAADGVIILCSLVGLLPMSSMLAE